VDPSLRRLGQLLVVMGALLGAVTGVALALLAEHAEPGRAVGVAGRERAAVLATHPPSSHAPASQAASSQEPADASAVSGNQRAESVDQRTAKADKHSQGRGNKAEGRGKDKPGKGKGTDK
jgi:hypothetical protein